MPNRVLAGLDWPALEHVARTTVAATLSLATAQLFRIPEPHWAAISSLVVTQSTLGATFTISSQRFAGTVMGAAAGGLLASYLKPGIPAFTLGLIMLGLVCAVLRADRAAYRFAGITMAIVVFASQREPAWAIAAHRFLAVSLGIVTALGMTALWPEHKFKNSVPAAPQNRGAAENESR
jgi:uncharacterized membrane protein YccC